MESFVTLNSLKRSLDFHLENGFIIGFVKKLDFIKRPVRTEDYKLVC